MFSRGRAPARSPLFYTSTSTEYWTRAASLLHTDGLGEVDIPLDPKARLYVIAGAQHGNWRFPTRGPYQNCGNPLDHRPPLRALLLALDAWATGGREPPASVYPRIADRTLGSVEEYVGRFPGSRASLCRTAIFSRRAWTSAPALRRGHRGQAAAGLRPALRHARAAAGCRRQ